MNVTKAIAPPTVNALSVATNDAADAAANAVCFSAFTVAART
jgi:hypothetical protein